MSDNGIEYAIICIDNSDYMRNEDIRPNRFIAQKDSANIICHHILSSRPENRIGIVTLADNPQAIQSLTNNEINVMRKLYDIKMKGETNLVVAIKVSILALKQISSKGLVTANKRLRIIAFVGSPFKEDPKVLDSLVAKLNKMNISVDIISFGSENGNKTQILDSFVKKLKNSNFLNIPIDRVMTNILAESPILSHSRDVALVNENMDPELALAMKLSVDQNKNQFDEDLKKAMNESTNTSTESAVLSPSSSDEELQKAIEMSLNFMKEHNIPTKGLKSQKTQNNNIQSKTNTENRVLKEEEQLALFLQMSLLEKQKQSKHSSNGKKEPKKEPKKEESEKSKNNQKKNNQNQ